MLNEMVKPRATFHSLGHLRVCFQHIFISFSHIN